MVPGVIEANLLRKMGVENPTQYITCNGYIVIQQRVDNTNFDLTLNDYKDAFGNPPDGSFWLGLDVLYGLTKNISYSWTLRIEVDISGATKIAEYSNFAIGPGDTYQLLIGRSSFPGFTTLHRSKIPYQSHIWTVSLLRYHIPDFAKN